MTPPDTPTEAYIREQIALAEAATPGPWRSLGGPPGVLMNYTTAPGRTVYATKDGATLAVATFTWNDENGHFIAAARDAVPVLGRALLTCMQERDDYKRFAPDWVRLTRPAISELDRRDDMIRELRTTLGMFEGAQPVAPQAVWEEALCAVREHVAFVRVVARDFPAVFGRCWNADARAFLADPPPAGEEGTYG